MSHLCTFCDAKLSSKSALTTHLLRARYCLKKRESKIDSSSLYECESCSKSYSTKQCLLRHYEVCVQHCTKKITDELTLKYSREIRELKEQVVSLQDKLENVAIKAASRPTTTNKVSVNAYIQNMQPITDQLLTDYLPKLTIEHVKKGAEGYAQYALDYPLKDKLACVDYSRKKVKYKDHNGNVITDPEMANLTTKFFKSIQDRNKDLFKECAITFREKCDEESFDKMATLAETLAGVNGSSAGSKSDFSQDFIKEVCKATIRQE